MSKKTISCYIAICIVIILAGTLGGFAQSGTRINISGKAFEESNGNLKPIKQATIIIKEFGIITSSQSDGSFEIKNIPTVNHLHLTGSYLGKVDIDTLIAVKNNQKIQLVFKENSFRLQDVDVVAKKSDNTVGTSSTISSTAIEHLQANSLADVMSLMPGGLTSNPNLTGAKQINIRAISGSLDNSNAFGTSIIVNGAPTSNNANLQALNPTVSGATASMSGGASPAGGFDVRNIPVQNIESIEVIRGIPSVSYGDATSGAVVVNQKAGRQPLIVEARTNPNVYGINASQGIILGQNGAALNLGADYSYNTNDPVQAYKFYQRATFSSLYSNQFFNNKLSTNTGVNLNFGKDTRTLNPDDEITKTKSHAKELGGSIYSNGRISVLDQWLKSITYSGRISYTDKQSYLQEQYTAATAPYSMTYTDGATLTNFPGKKFYDKDGKEITHIPAGEENLYALYLPSTYVGEYQILGKELNAFAQTSAIFFNRIGNTFHNWKIGADLKYDKNYGDGKTFADSLPPYRNLGYVNATFRKRKYKDIPGLKQIGVFVEENFTTKIAERRLNIIAGIRYDRFNESKSAFSPRVNAELELIPKVFQIRGGYGLLSKSPSLLYLSPENAYFEYVNINELATTAIPANERVFMTTTRVFNTENDDLKIAKNKKAEVGFDIMLGKSILSVTGFQEKLVNGYQYGLTTNSFRPTNYIEYKRVNNASPIYSSTSNPVLAKFNMPNNNLNIEKKGIEFELNLKRFDAIRTQFNLNGMYIEQKIYNGDYNFYDNESGTGGATRTHIGLYNPKMEVAHEKSFVNSLRTVHNIPSIGFVVTLTTEVIWNESQWSSFANDSIPEKYISKIDGKIYDFDPSRKDEAEFKSILRIPNRVTEKVESLPPMLNFNINVTKEIKDFMRVSFFANNMFRSYPIAQSDRVKSTYYQRNIPFFFGLNLSLKIK